MWLVIAAVVLVLLLLWWWWGMPGLNLQKEKANLTAMLTGAYAHQGLGPSRTQTMADVKQSLEQA